MLIAAGPETPNFKHGIHLAAAAIRQGILVYLYCIDDAVTGLDQAPLQALKNQGLKLFACAHSAQLHHIPLSDQAAFSGLSILSDIMADTDRFVSFI
jgi:sulfur relay (sulfurtransferase) complex TusBCD TusD component (DsrE family)